MVFSGGSVGKESACNAGDPGSVPGWGRSLEKKMATHSSILAWEIPWAEEPGRLQSTGSQGVGHDFHFPYLRAQSASAESDDRPTIPCGSLSGTAPSSHLE